MTRNKLKKNMDILLQSMLILMNNECKDVRNLVEARCKLRKQSKSTIKRLLAKKHLTAIRLG